MKMLHTINLSNNVKHETHGWDDRIIIKSCTCEKSALFKYMASLNYMHLQFGSRLQCEVLGIKSLLT